MKTKQITRKGRWNGTKERQHKEAGEGVYGSEPGIYFLRNASQGMTCVLLGVGIRGTHKLLTLPIDDNFC